MSLDIALYSTISIKCPHCGENVETKDEIVYDRNITHNLSKMAHEAGLSPYTWDCYDTKAKEAIKPLKNGIKDMKDKPKHYKQFSASNGWGTYEQFIPWLEDYLKACEENPEALIYISK